MIRHVHRFWQAACLTVAIVGLAVASPARAEYVNCVQFVQQATGLDLRGDAHQWWDHASGRYARGHVPHDGAVMVFAKARHMRHGHVGVVRDVINNRTILLDHANWSPVGGRRGRVENAVTVIDVSPRNDWSKVRVWYDPVADIGQRVYAVKGFVYATSNPVLRAY